MTQQLDTLAKFGSSFQTKAISVMLADRSFLDQAHDIIEPKQFDTEANSWIVEKILWYFESYKDIPSLDVFKQEVDKVKNDDGLRTSIITSLRDVHKNINSSDIKYVKDEFLLFCKNQSLKNAIMKAAEKLQGGDYDGIKSIIDKAMRAGQERNYGHHYSTDLEKRVARMVRNCIPTEWNVINQIMDGGLAGGELGVVVAPPGIGKSWALASIGKAAIQAGKRVIHYTLELNENYLGLRYDTLLTGIEPNQVKNHVEEVKRAVGNVSGELYIKYYPTKSISSNALKAHIERMKGIGFIPDLITVDYGDLLRPTERGDKKYQDLGIVYEDLRRLAGEINIPIWTASQSHRASVQDDIIEGDKIADSFNKIMIADFILSLSRKMADKVSNTARIHIIKNRFGPDGITFPALVNFVEGKFQIYDENSSEGIRLKKQMADGDNTVKSLLQKKLLDFSKDSFSDDL